jgi:hypothetical protein
MRTKLILGLTIALFTVTCPIVSNAQQIVSPSIGFDRSITRFLRKQLTDSHYRPDRETRYSVAVVRPKGSKTEDVVVYISGQRWCGSGGCTLLVLETAGSSFKVLGRTTIVQLPIYVLPTMTNGHPDIAVRVQGGGIERGYLAKLSFDGERYPANPSVPPAQRLSGAAGAVKLISTIAVSRLLYR